jgi:RNA polymerase sigma factor (sigma-70 family)
LLKEKSDEELMVLYQLGDEFAFRELYSRHSKRVYSFLKARVRSEPLARDIFQSTFLKLHRSRTRYSAELPFTPWLFTICRSELIDALRKLGRAQENIQTGIVDIQRVEISSPVDLSNLTAKQQEALTLRYSEGFSFEEVARVLETSPSNARKIVSRAVKVLRSLYGKK